jgi:serine/threonine-protein kinase
MEGLLDGRYRLAEEIARGAIGVVWRGTDLLTGEDVAVKLPRTGPSGRPDVTAALRREADLLAELAHPGVVGLRDVLTVDGRPALVLDLVDGEDLRRRVRRTGPLPPAAAARMVAQVAEALAYLHRIGIVHGDVKPANVLVPADDGPVRLADLGVARRLTEDSLGRTILATPEYVAPEVVAGAPPTEAADVYATGITLFEVLTGRSPFRGGPPEEVLHRHGRCVPVPPPGLPPVVWSLIEDCLAVPAAARPRADLLAERLRGLEAALDGAAPLPATPPERVTWWPRPVGAPTAVARVRWVPLGVAPVSPGSAYAGRMVAVPIGAGAPAGGPPEPPSEEPPGTTVGTRRPARRGRRLAVAGAVAAALVALAAAGGALLGGDDGGADGRRTAIPAPGADASPGPRTAPSGAPSPGATAAPGTGATGDGAGGDPAGSGTDGGRRGGSGSGSGGSDGDGGNPGGSSPGGVDGGSGRGRPGASPLGGDGTAEDSVPDTGGLPGIGDPMPTMPAHPATR